MPGYYHRTLYGSKHVILRDIEKKTGTEIRFPPREDGRDEVVIYGPKGQLSPAKAMLLVLPTYALLYRDVLHCDALTSRRSISHLPSSFALKRPSNSWKRWHPQISPALSNRSRGSAGPPSLPRQSHLVQWASQWRKLCYSSKARRVLLSRWEKQRMRSWDGLLLLV